MVFTREAGDVLAATEQAHSDDDESAVCAAMREKASKSGVMVRECADEIEFGKVEGHKEHRYALTPHQYRRSAGVLQRQ